MNEIEQVSTFDVNLAIFFFGKGQVTESILMRFNNFHPFDVNLAFSVLFQQNRVQ